MQVITRTVELENGNKVNFKTDVKYPYWRVSFEKGGIPDSLSGMYMTYEDALKAVKKYVERRASRNRTKVKEV